MKSLFSALAGVLLVLSVSPVRAAEDSTTTKMENATSDASTHAKKGARHAKRHARKLMGTDNVGKDMKDGVNDMGDDMHNAAKKTDNKINH